MNDEESKLEYVADTQNDKEDPDSVIYKYYSHGNFLSKNIISEQRSLAKFLGDRWQELDFSRKDALLDLLFVEDDIRQQLAESGKVEEKIQESFPRLYINSGQKINVDFENDLWTWRDEHSGPFSWMSRSQQDLTLDDLEPENISKPQPKTIRVDTDNPDNLTDVESQFQYPSNCWSRDIIDDYRKAERHITLSPCTSLEFSSSKSGQQDEEINEAFEKSQQGEIVQESRNKNIEEKSEESSNDFSIKRKNSKEKRRKSPSPKKILRSSSLRRSPSKASDQGEQQLISKHSDDNYEEQNTFSNPVVETEWSSFIGDNGVTKTDRDDTADQRVHGLPPSQIIDHGEDLVVTSSPYQVQHDNIHLITPNDSPAQGGRGGVGGAGKMYTMTNDLEGWSAESTPDHTTHLLKGMQTNQSMKTESSHQFSAKENSVLEKYEDEEILTVESQGTGITITTESENKRDSDIPTTGFDFLDNW